VFAWSCLLLIRGILAALRQKFHLSACPNLTDHWSAPLGVDRMRDWN
jgi:hypothetical protein